MWVTSSTLLITLALTRTRPRPSRQPRGKDQNVGGQDVQKVRGREVKDVRYQGVQYAQEHDTWTLNERHGDGNIPMESVRSVEVSGSRTAVTPLPAHRAGGVLACKRPKRQDPSRSLQQRPVNLRRRAGGHVHFSCRWSCAVLYFAYVAGSSAHSGLYLYSAGPLCTARCMCCSCLHG